MIIVGEKALKDRKRKDIRWKFESDVYAKKYAIEFFPGYFGSDFNVLSIDNYSREVPHNLCSISNLGDIRDKMNKGLEFYDLARLESGYGYIKENLGKRIELDTEDTSIVMNSYNRLITEICNYKFLEKRENSYGGIQNKVSENILFELSLMKDLVVDSLINIDKYILVCCGRFSDEVCLKLYNIKIRLDECEKKLMDARRLYHLAWNKRANRECLEECYNDDLGYLKKKWRLSRNDACSLVIEVIGELVDLNNAINYGTFDYMDIKNKMDDVIEIDELYKINLKMIAKSKNRFCYLKTSEKEEISQKKKRERIMRRGGF